jgi:hypothetical protein
MSIYLVPAIAVNTKTSIIFYITLSSKSFVQTFSSDKNTTYDQLVVDIFFSLRTRRTIISTVVRATRYLSLAFILGTLIDAATIIFQTLTPCICYTFGY